MKTNCGGNGYALTVCRSYLLTAQMLAEENHSGFEISKLGENDKINLVKLTQSSWLRGADFLVQTNFAWSNAQQQIVIVCDKGFDNAPKLGWIYFWRNSAHAVGYSDGTAGLISSEDFTNLNLNGFVSLSSLATNSEFKISKP